MGSAYECVHVCVGPRFLLSQHSPVLSNVGTFANVLHMSFTLSGPCVNLIVNLIIINIKSLRLPS